MRVVDVPAYLMHETDDAFLFNVSGDQVIDNESRPVEGVWVPKSLAEWIPDDKVVVVPEWFAVKKGMV